MNYSDLCRIAVQVKASCEKRDAENIPCWCDGITVHSDWCASIRHGLQQIEWAIEDEFPIQDAGFKEIPNIH